MRKRDYTTLEYILTALIPYSRANIDLSFHPGKFFSELERTSKRNKNSLQSGISKAISRGYVRRINGSPVLTNKGFERIAPLVAKKLDKDVYLMVAFDIPEDMRYKRRSLRRLLKERGFEQSQRSLWVCPYDHSEELRLFIEQQNLSQYVDMYECAKL